ncbi:MAG TPA: DUF2924 domain-containing protein [Bryobacteraceae bacterium]|nr:DUF2924 domain-containing protein [Bryobacteraceae bacterium]
MNCSATIRNPPTINTSFGGSPDACKRAAQLADDVDLRLRAPRRFWTQLAARDASRPLRDTRLPEAGTVLRRDYQGRAIEVTVLADGFVHEGRAYRSLSAIAYAITGTRWNGLLFFGLIQRGSK